MSSLGAGCIVTPREVHGLENLPACTCSVALQSAMSTSLCIARMPGIASSLNRLSDASYEDNGTLRSVLNLSGIDRSAALHEILHLLFIIYDSKVGILRKHAIPIVQFWLSTPCPFRGDLHYSATRLVCHKKHTSLYFKVTY